RFWKAANESGTHTGHLWTAAGTLLATVTFANETNSGWQQQAFTSPVQISANTQYVVSVNTGNSFYVATNGGLASVITNMDLSSVVGNDGLYGSPGAFPKNTFQNSNYFRDVVFFPGAFTASGTISPAASGAGATVTLSGSSTGSVTADANGNYSLAVGNGTYTITPSKSGFSFSPASQNVTINGANQSGLNFTATALTYT